MEVISEATSSTDLSHLLAFLEKLLPASCDMHAQLVYKMRSNIPVDRFYYLRDPSDGQESYLAVAALTLHERLDSTRNIQKSWRVTGWATNSRHLEHLLRNINAIDWDRDFVKIFAQDSEQTPIMHAFLSDKIKKEISSDIIVNVYWIDRADVDSFEIEIPDEVYVKDLEPSYASQIYDKWIFNFTASAKDMASVLTHLPSVGIFLKANDELVCWAACHPPGGGISHLYTLEEHRSKGYAPLAVRCLCKKFVQVGMAPFACISPSNKASSKLFSKLGFQHVRSIRFLYANLDNTDPSC